MSIYETLTEKLKEAKTAAETIAAKTDDGGTSNFDTMYFSIPNKRRANIEQAIHKADLHYYYDDHLKAYFVLPPVSSQGNRRTAQAEAMYDVLKQIPYCKVGMWYQID